MNKRKVNDIRVKAVLRDKPFSHKNVHAYDMFQHPYPNVACIASKNSGKTVSIFNMLKERLCPGAKVYIFCPSVHRDSTYKQIKRLVKERGCELEAHDHFIQGKGKNKEDLIDKLLEDHFGMEDKPTRKKIESEKQDIDLYTSMFGFQQPVIQMGDNHMVETPKKPSERKRMASDVFVILDDLSRDMRAKSINRLLSRNRHIKASVFMCCHSCNDLLPSSLVNLDYLLLFPNIGRKKIGELHERLGLPMEEEQFQKLYKDATCKKYNFLYCDRKSDKYRCCFDEEYDF